MTPRTAMAVGTSSVPQPEATERSTQRRHITRLLILPAMLALALLAVACDNSSSPSSTASSDITQGLKAESAGQNQQAAKDFIAATTANPADAVAYYDLGAVYQEQLNNTAAAIAAYNKALLADPKYKPAMFNLATLESSSDPQAAIGLYNKILALNPNDANSNFNLGLLLIAQNQATEGHAALQKAISINPALAKRVPAGITP
jgi:tetratricopeptide (TPR) repeat protein